MSKDKFQDKYRIESARAKWHDYDNGFYFVTFCTKNREYFFGTIQNTEMVLSETGKYVQQQLQTIGEHYLYAEIPLWTIMPNHIHLIVSIDGGRLPHKKRNIPILEKNSHSENAGLEGTNTITSSFNIGSINATIYLDPVTSTSSTMNDVKCVRSEN